MKPTTSPHVISATQIAQALKLIDDELCQLRKDYFPSLDKSVFLKNHIYPDSSTLIMLQARCFYLGLANIIVTDELVSFVSEYMPSLNLYEVCFIRYHHPGMTSNGIDRIDNVVAAPLHYDSYGAPTLTTWVPLQNITAQTGSLCFTYSQNLIKLTGAGLSPYDMHTIGLSEEIKNSYINSLRNELEYVECNAGQVFIFDKNLLHGSTYPISAERVSVDIRWIKSELSESDNRQRIQKTLLRIRRNALRAIYLNGDTKFLSRIKITDFFATHLKMRLRRFRALQILHRKFKG